MPLPLQLTNKSLKRHGVKVKHTTQQIFAATPYCAYDRQFTTYEQVFERTTTSSVARGRQFEDEVRILTGYLLSGLYPKDAATRCKNRIT